jgi:hypothetical protein
MLMQSMLNKRGTIEKRSFTIGTTGSKLYTWNPYMRNVAMRLDQSTSPKEYSGDTRIIHKASHVIFMNRQPVTLNPVDYRIVIDGAVYNILDVVDAGGAKHHVEFPVEKVL